MLKAFTTLRNRILSTVLLLASITWGGNPLDTLQSAVAYTRNQPSDVVVTPDGRFVYSINTGAPRASNGLVSVFKVDTLTGKIAKVGKDVAAGYSYTSHGAMHPSGRFLYVSNSQDGTISAYSIGSDGGLKSMGGSPFPTPGPYPCCVQNLVIDTSGTNLYAFKTYQYSQDSPVSGYIAAYTIDPVSGKLQPLTPSTYPAYDGGWVATAGMALTPDGRFALATGSMRGISKLFAYPRNSDGSLGSASDSVLTASGDAMSIVADRRGRVYVGNVSSNNISGFSLSSAGKFAPLQGSPYATVSGSQSLALEKNGYYLYAASSYLAAYAIDSATGKLSLKGSPVIAGPQPGGIASSPGSQYLYVANYGSGTGNGSLSSYVTDIPRIVTRNEVDMAPDSLRFAATLGNTALVDIAEAGFYYGTHLNPTAADARAPGVRGVTSLSAKAPTSAFNTTTIYYARPYLKNQDGRIFMGKSIAYQRAKMFLNPTHSYVAPDTILLDDEPFTWPIAGYESCGFGLFQPGSTTPSYSVTCGIQPSLETGMEFTARIPMPLPGVPVGDTLEVRAYFDVNGIRYYNWDGADTIINAKAFSVAVDTSMWNAVGLTIDFINNPLYYPSASFEIYDSLKTTLRLIIPANGNSATPVLTDTLRPGATYAVRATAYDRVWSKQFHSDWKTFVYQPKLVTLARKLYLDTLRLEGEVRAGSSSSNAGFLIYKGNTFPAINQAAYDTAFTAWSGSAGFFDNLRKNFSISGGVYEKLRRLPGRPKNGIDSASPPEYGIYQARAWAYVGTPPKLVFGNLVSFNYQASLSATVVNVGGDSTKITARVDPRVQRANVAGTSSPLPLAWCENVVNNEWVKLGSGPLAQSTSDTTSWSKTIRGIPYGPGVAYYCYVQIGAGVGNYSVPIKVRATTP